MAKVIFEGGDKIKMRESTLPIQGTLTEKNLNDLRDANNDNDTRIAILESGGATESIVAFAQWIEDFKFFVTADKFPVENTFYSATNNDVILESSDLLLDRIDIIGAYKPILPATVGVVGKITGTPASEGIVAAPDYDPSQFYPIKIVYVKAGSAVPDGVDTELVYDENTGGPSEWDATTNSLNIVANSTNDPNTGLVSFESTNQIVGQRIILTSDTVISTTDINLITFFLKLKEVYGQEYIFVRFYDSIGGEIGSQYNFRDGENGFSQSNLSYQQISIDTAKLNLPDASVKSIEIYLYKSFAGFFLDTIQLHKGSGNEVKPPNFNLPSNLAYTDVKNTFTEDQVFNKDVEVKGALSTVGKISAAGIVEHKSQINTVDVKMYSEPSYGIIHAEKNGTTSTGRGIKIKTKDNDETSITIEKSGDVIVEETIKAADFILDSTAATPTPTDVFTILSDLRTDVDAIKTNLGI